LIRTKKLAILRLCCKEEKDIELGEEKNAFTLVRIRSLSARVNKKEGFPHFVRFFRNGALCSIV
jgi:hypothetical protein